MTSLERDMEQITREEMIELLRTVKGNTLYTHRGCKFLDDIDKAIAALQAAEPVLHAFADDLQQAATSEYAVNAYSIEMGDPDRGKTVPLFTLPCPPAKTEAKPAYRCHVCKAEVPPPEAFKLYVSCLSCGELTAATIAKDLAQPAKAQGDQLSERALFEQSFPVSDGVFFSEKLDRYQSMNGRESEELDARELTLKLQGWRKARSVKAQVPVGWKLVPIEPTQDMTEAGKEYCEYTGTECARLCYEAMLAASPAPDHIPNAAKLVEAADSLSRLLEHKIPGHFLKRVEPQLSDFIDEITNYSRKQEEAER